jgi:hypothetical protein
LTRGSWAIVSTSPSANTAPLTSTVTVRAKLKTRSMSCSMSTIETSAGKALIVSKISCRSPSGTPATGSSSRSTRGAQASAIAISRRRRLP